VRPHDSTALSSARRRVLSILAPECGLSGDILATTRVSVLVKHNARNFRSFRSSAQPPRFLGTYVRPDSAADSPRPRMVPLMGLGHSLERQIPVEIDRSGGRSSSVARDAYVSEGGHGAMAGERRGSRFPPPPARRGARDQPLSQAVRRLHRRRSRLGRFGPPTAVTVSISSSIAFACASAYSR
jgi:hypothetical protein